MGGGEGGGRPRAGPAGAGPTGAEPATWFLSFRAWMRDGQPWGSLLRPQKEGAWEESDSFTEMLDYFPRPSNASFPRGSIVVWLRWAVWSDVAKFAIFPVAVKCCTINLGEPPTPPPKYLSSKRLPCLLPPPCVSVSPIDLSIVYL